MNTANVRPVELAPAKPTKAKCDYCQRVANLTEYSARTSVWAALYFGALCPDCFRKQTKACRKVVKQQDPGLFERLRQEEDRP